MKIHKEKKPLDAITIEELTLVKNETIEEIAEILVVMKELEKRLEMILPYVVNFDTVRWSLWDLALNDRKAYLEQIENQIEVEYLLKNIYSRTRSN